MFKNLFGQKRRAEAKAPPPNLLPDPGERLYVIGDIHGRNDLLDAMLERMIRNARAQRDQRASILVFLGDYIDRGDHSREVLVRIQQEIADPSAPWARVVCLRGNHEAALLSFLEDAARGSAWLGYGGKQTLASYGVPVPLGRNPGRAQLEDTAAILRARMGTHVRFLESTERFLRSGDVWCSHSGLDPDCAPTAEAQSDDALLWGRSDFLERGPPPGVRAVHGHWDQPQEVVTPQRIGLDTGAYYTGCLTGARLDTGTLILSVDSIDLP